MVDGDLEVGGGDLVPPGGGAVCEDGGREAVDIEVVKTVDIGQVDAVSVAVRKLTLGEVK
jgi:hypothetical protein